MAKYCINCGQRISDNAAFCKYCGSSQEGNDRYTSEFDPVAATPEDDLDQEIREILTEQKKAIKAKSSQKMFLFIGLALALIVAVGIAGFKMYHSKVDEDIPAADTTPKEVTEEQNADKSEKEDTQNDSSQNEQKGTKKGTGNATYQEGKVYYVQTNLRVREGPGKTYRILDRSELLPGDYAQSVDSTTTTDALMEKGAAITCLEMQGNWMRIESGWVCVEDEGEVLVK